MPFTESSIYFTSYRVICFSKFHSYFQRRYQKLVLEANNKDVIPLRKNYKKLMTENSFIINCTLLMETNNSLSN